MVMPRRRQVASGPDSDQPDVAIETFDDQPLVAVAGSEDELVQTGSFATFAVNGIGEGIACVAALAGNHHRLSAEQICLMNGCFYAVFDELESIEDAVTGGEVIVPVRTPPVLAFTSNFT